MPDLAFGLLTKEPLVVVLPSDHRLAALEAISPHDIVGETFISVAENAPTLRVVINDYLKGAGIDIIPDHEVSSLSMAISLVCRPRASPCCHSMHRISCRLPSRAGQ